MRKATLDALVRLKGVDTAPAPAQALFVNDLAGMGGELLENLTSREAETLAEVWAKVKRRAKTALLDALALRLADLYDWQRLVYQSPALDVSKRPIPFPTGATSAGLAVELFDAQGLDVFLDGVQLFLDGTDSGQVELLLLDLATSAPLAALDALGQPLGVLTFDVAPGLNYLPVGGRLRFDAQADFYVGVRGLADFDPLGAGLLELNLDQAGPLSYTPAVTSGPSDYDDPLVIGFATGPLVLDVRVECSLDQALDRNPTAWAPCWLYLLGSEILKEKIFSPRTNYWASGNLAITETNQVALDRQYQASLGRLARRLDVSALCATCDTSTGTSYEADQVV